MEIPATKNKKQKNRPKNLERYTFIPKKQKKNNLFIVDTNKLI